MDNLKIDISVVIPAFNEEKFIALCLESLKKQNFVGNYEVIVVDNNSTDNTSKVAAESGFKTIVEYRKGVCFARQRGAEEARGELIVTTDADCVLPPDWLKNIYSEFSKNENLVAVTGPFRFTPIPRWGERYSKMLFKIVRILYEKKNKIIYVGASNFAFKNRLFKEVGGYNTELAQGGDEYDLFRRLVSKGPAAYIHENRVLTSSRRLAKGMFYSLFVTMLGYYILDYLIASKITGKSFFGQYPPFREHVIESTRIEKVGSFVSGFVIASVLIISMFFIISPNTAKAKTLAVAHGSKKFANFLKNGLHHLREHHFDQDNNIDA